MTTSLKPGDLIVTKWNHVWIFADQFISGVGDVGTLKRGILGIVLAVDDAADEVHVYDTFVLFPGPIIGWTLASELERIERDG